MEIHQHGWMVRENIEEDIDFPYVVSGISDVYERRNDMQAFLEGSKGYYWIESISAKGTGGFNLTIHFQIETEAIAFKLWFG